jgi:hypothetical protein
MSDVDRELERALDAWRAETDGAVPPPELVPRIVRRAEAQASSMFAALATLGVRPLLAPSATAAVLVAWALSAVHALLDHGVLLALAGLVP